MTITEKVECCAGCFTCYNACPFDAISMELSEDGFYVPKINENCENCGLCEIVCPIINPPKAKLRKPLSFAGWSKNENVRFESSSGGVFSELAVTALERRGVVYGVALDENFLPKHVRVTKTDELKKIRGSKYVQSYVGNSYRKAISDLKSEKIVLFSGVPCQIAGLKNLVENSNTPTESLITVDLVCHGVPSMKVYTLYLEHVSKGRKINNINFRDKEAGWSKYQMKIEFEDGESYRKVHKRDPFFKIYLLDLALNKICYNCPFSKIPRQGDITLGDFWGVPANLKDERGVSVVLINNEKGEKFVKNINTLEIVEVPFELAVKGNPRIVSGVLAVPKVREKILKKNNFRDIEKIAKRELLKRKLFSIRHLLDFNFL